MIPEIDVITLAGKQEAEEQFFLLDVREPHEADLCKIDGSMLIPLGQIPQRAQEIPKDLPVIIYCHHGGRSARALQFLQTQGFNEVYNVKGGIDAWAVEIEPEMVRY